MPRRTYRHHLKSTWSTLRRVGPRCLLALAVGCRSAASPYTCEPTASSYPRGVILAEQVITDSAAEVASQPLLASWQGVAETASHVAVLSEGEFGKRVVVPLEGKPPPLGESKETLDLQALEADLQQLTGKGLEPVDLRLQLTGQDSLEALDSLIRQAQHSIDVIMFQWDCDDLGRTIAARLAAVASPNLHIRILVDGGGNLFFCEPDNASADQVNKVMQDLSRHPNVEVIRIRNPFARYDHRKLVLVDGKLAWTGGRNFSKAAFFEHHDLSFVLDGALVAQYQEHFNSAWQQQGGQGPTPPVMAGNTEALAAPNGVARLLVSAPGNRQMSTAIYEAVDRSKHHIYVENVYLTDSLLIFKLEQARQRGVDVRVILTVDSTTPTINQSARVVANRLLQAGVRVYLYPGMTHVKAICIDGVWAYLGTGNFDPLSFRHNTELGLAISRSAIIQELEQRLFLPDMLPATEMRQALPTTFFDWLCEWVASICL